MKITKSKYSAIHHWIKYHHGKAIKCTNKKCEGKSTNFNWALLKGKQYDYNVKNFTQMCRPCHAKYDCTEETRIKCRQKNYNTYKKKCFRGHLFAGINLRFLPNGYRVCRECNKMRDRKIKARKKLERMNTQSIINQAKEINK